MRFSIIHLLLVLTSWPIAYVLVPNLMFPRLGWHSGVASPKNLITSVEHIANRMHRDGNLTHANLVSRPCFSDPRSTTDSWGNQLQFVCEESGELAVEGGTVLAYSFGQDGKSDSNGNDADDVNSWDDHEIPFYTNQIQNYKTRIRLGRTLLVAPLVFIGLLIGKRTLSFAFSKGAV